MRGFKILPFLVLLFLCLAFAYSQHQSSGQVENKDRDIETAQPQSL
jgi:hypothetical protein